MPNSLGHAFALSRHETWPTPYSEIGVGHIALRRARISCQTVLRDSRSSFDKLRNRPGMTPYYSPFRYLSQKALFSAWKCWPW